MKPQRTSDSIHVVLAGGATGGHLFPGLAVADQLRAIAPAVQITFATGHKPLERQQVAAAGFHQLRLRSRPLPEGLRGGLRGIWRFLADNMAGYRAARRFVRSENVALVVGLGGYSSLPMAAAAARLGVPLVLLEQNSAPGRVNRWLAPRAALVCVAFEETRALLKSHGPVRVTGVPIRAGSAAPLPKRLRNLPAERQLLVLGGSGARTLNEQAPKSLYRLRSQLTGWRIVHQSGSREHDATAKLYRKLDLEAMVVPFLDPIQPMLHHASLVVCRAAGGTLAELAAASAPAVLLPNPHVSHDHQRKNADVLAREGAARVVDERACSGRLDEALALAIGDLLADELQRRRMATAIGAFAHPDAAWHVATMVHDLACAARLRAVAGGDSPNW
jgi:UDP-N-acetylglucosamine--N-acetylmuramyl-(pentapeptide) pyrophosphoryl-undecaprenol N-acetylglucosamine transferase